MTQMTIISASKNFYLFFSSLLGFCFSCNGKSSLMILVKNTKHAKISLVFGIFLSVYFSSNTICSISQPGKIKTWKNKQNAGKGGVRKK